MKFDPNEKNKGVPVIKWATYIPDRTPNFKIHKQINHAKSAFQYRNNAILYERVDEEWIERYRRELDGADHPRYCQWCEKDTYDEGISKWSSYYAGSFIWPKTGELVTHWVCYDCGHKHYRGAKPPVKETV